ncbi:MAG: S8 family serine peptidase [Xanthomonadaceae bacterium]|nr:S8 family serine peptidase [Xanthomonadaceae bacterium]
MTRFRKTPRIAKNGLHSATVMALATFAFAAGQPSALAAGGASGTPDSAMRTYIIQFEDAPLASFRGEVAGQTASASGGAGKRLAATSPAITGAAKLDVDAPASRVYRAYLGERRDEHLLQAQRNVGRALLPSHVYDVVFNGVAVELTPDEAEEIARQPGVRRIAPDWVDSIQTDAGPPWIQAPQLWNGVAGLQSRGEGVVVGVIDTGITPTHLSFAATSGGFTHSNPRGQLLGLCASAQATCNSKLIGVYDFTTGTGDGEPNNGLDGEGHGTHVASTVAGNRLQTTISGVVRPISGVAPRANLISYKACEGTSQCRGSWLLAALGRAAADGVDVVNYSIGGEARDPWNSFDADAMLSLRDAGVLSVVAAGNSGPGAGTVTSPGNAPWVLTVAAATHTRFQGNQLLLSGGDSPPPDGGSLFGASASGGSAELLFDRDPAEPLCSTGSGTGLLPGSNNEPDGSSNPWPNEPNKFSGGKIVTCLRGIQARVAKSDNVRRAGGSASVLINQQFDGASVVADPHSIPTTHLTFQDGQKLLSWLSTGTGHRGRVTEPTLQDAPSRADVLASFSGRGPNPGGGVDVRGVLKPEVTAPGVAVRAALESSDSAVGNLSGTSMATPHVAGAAALLIGATRNAGRSPAWRADQLAAALVGTARASGRDSDGVGAANAFAQGAGVIDLALAARAGLYFPSAVSGFPTFANANPAAGGRPRELNLPSLAHESCFQSCQLTRRVVDLRGGGSWRVEPQVPDGMTVTANVEQFALAANAGQTLTFTIAVQEQSLAGRWQFGSVRLRNLNNDGTPDIAMPLAVFVDPGNVPSNIVRTVTSDAGHLDLPLSGLIPLPSARFESTALVPVQRNAVLVPEDPTEGDPYDGGVGVHTLLVQIPANTGSQQRRWRLVVDARSATARDIDLFVGEDSNGDGVAEEDEEECFSIALAALEACDVEIIQLVGAPQRTYWILVQNFDAGSTGTDQIEIDHALVPMETDAGGLVFTGPGTVASQAAFNLRMAWDDPSLLPGESRRAFLLLSSLPGSVVAEIPVRIGLSATVNQYAARALAHGQPQTVRLPAGASHERIFFDVPGNASQVTWRMTNAGDYDLFVAKAGALNNSNASIGAAPARGQALRQVTGTTATKTVTLSGTDLSPGRWYVTPVARSGGTTAQISATIDSQTASQRRFTHYFNPDRSGHGLLFDDAGNGSTWLAVWYTYLADGSATWYLMAGAAPAANAGQWTVPLLRVAWDGTVGSVTEVGQATLSFTGENPGGLSTLVFSYQLDGETGSERMQELTASRNCPTAGGSLLNVTGHWFPPSKPGAGQPGFGYSVQTEPEFEFYAAYLYDGQGIPRWLLANRSGFNAGANTLTIEQFSNGPCPACTGPGVQPAPRVQVGTLNRVFSGGSLSSVEVAAQFAAPLTGNWLESLPVARLSDPKVCP